MAGARGPSAPVKKSSPQPFPPPVLSDNTAGGLGSRLSGFREQMLLHTRGQSCGLRWDTWRAFPLHSEARSPAHPDSRGGRGPTSPWRGVCSRVVKPPHGDILYRPGPSISLGIKPESFQGHLPMPSATLASLRPPSSSIAPLQPPQLAASLSVSALSTRSPQDLGFALPSALPNCPLISLLGHCLVKEACLPPDQGASPSLSTPSCPVTVTGLTTACALEHAAPD